MLTSTLQRALLPILAHSTALHEPSMMKSALSLAVAALTGTNLAESSTPTASSPVTEYTLQADGITAKFIPYGARLTSLIVDDRHGHPTDVVVGYDDPSQYLVDTQTDHTYFGAVVGRYANRIKNGTFTVDGQTYHIPANENGGRNTLHGGTIGYDQRNWTVLTHNESVISFSLLDTAFEGFPGTVLTTATYSVSTESSGPQGQQRPRLTTQLISIALDKPTPIMLSNHIYWNLNSFRQPTLLDDTSLWMPYSTRYIQTDGMLVPNGSIATTASTPALDFRSPRTFGDAITQTKNTNLCGTDCTGIDNAFLLDRPTTNLSPVLSMWSHTTGIQLDLNTNQPSLQLYTCNTLNGSIPIKPSQQQTNANLNSAAQTKYIQQFGCVAIEPQGYIDGINNPQWGEQNHEVFSPTTGPSVNHATYDFSVF